MGEERLNSFMTKTSPLICRANHHEKINALLLVCTRREYIP